MIGQKLKTAPPTGGHVFQRIGNTFELNQDIIKTNILTNFELSRDLIGTKLLTKFNEDGTRNVASRVLRVNVNGRTDGHTTDKDRLIHPTRVLGGEKTRERNVQGGEKTRGRKTVHHIHGLNVKDADDDADDSGDDVVHVVVDDNDDDDDDDDDDEDDDDDDDEDEEEEEEEEEED
ncbi:hypothetical protein DPMN_011047 [Dreissena polymorpha]|uniref:Uncharacterized protein n=1 Tax=Dreissena polymorpha TaxID=45954 RepID=A0A9D4N3B3_DREPO|nr:hypothetical protein DPMN_011047 [Dreissena polymorpha]